MSLTVKNGAVAFMWCGDAGQFDAFWIETKEDGQRSTVTTKGEGPYRLIRGQTFTAEAPPDGPNYSARGTIPIADGTSIYVGTLSNDGPGPTYRSAFNDVDLQSLSDGTWVTGGGRQTEEACE